VDRDAETRQRLPRERRVGQARLGAAAHHRGCWQLPGCPAVLALHSLPVVLTAYGLPSWNDHTVSYRSLPCMVPRGARAR